MTETHASTYRDYWDRAHDFPTYLGRDVSEHSALWNGVYRKATPPDWAVRQASELGGRWKLLVLSEDWCGDASNTLPALARFAEAVPGIELRVLKRDENPELIDRYLTNGSRSIPLAIVLDEGYEPVGRWGPRPAELQEFVVTEKRAGLRDKADIYKDARRWYARDRGETTLRELLEVLESAMPQNPELAASC
jgi:hypothetical protein